TDLVKARAGTEDQAMRMRLVILLTIWGVSVASAQQSPGPGWPPLPTSGFISGRPATDKDILEGKAVFALRAYGVPFGKPLDVTIPQYAYLKRRGQQPIPVIVVQAELGKGLKFYGVRDLNGKSGPASESELQLLITHRPDQCATRDFIVRCPG